MNKTTFSIKENFINQTKKASLFSVFFMTGLSFGQTTVFSDNFSRGSVSPGGTPSVTYTTLSLKNDRTPQTPVTASYSQIASTMPDGSVAPSINFPTNAFLNLLQTEIAANGAEDGTVQVTAPLSAYSSPFNPILNTNNQGIEWTFNMRTNRGTATASGLAGFSVDGAGTNYGLIVILAGSNSNVMQGGTGYAVTFQQGSGGASNTVSLRKYADGAYSCGSGCPLGGSTMATIISPSTPLANRWNFVSVKVTYNPSNDEWKLFVRDDGNLDWADPTTLTNANLVGTTIDNTYTATTMTTFGFYFKHSTNNVEQNQAFFDNYKVVLDPTLSTNSFDFVSTSLYPNPAKNQLTISSKASFNAIEIMNLLGQNVKEVTNKQGETTLTVDVSDLQNGTYIVKLNSNEGSSTTKFIKN